MRLLKPSAFTRNGAAEDWIRGAEGVSPHLAGQCNWAKDNRVRVGVLCLSWDELCAMDLIPYDELVELVAGSDARFEEHLVVTAKYDWAARLRHIYGIRSAEAANEGVPPDVGIRYQSPMTGIQAAVSQFSAPSVFHSSLQHAPVDASLVIPQPQQHNAPGSNQRRQRKTERRAQAVRQEGRMTMQDYQSRRHQTGRLLVKQARVAKAAMCVTNVDYFSGGQRP